MVDGFLRVFHRYLSTVSHQEQEQAQSQAAEGDAQAPPSNQPGVVMLQPLSPQEPAEQDAAKAPSADSNPPPKTN
jgi:hypothetical protein